VKKEDFCLCVVQQPNNNVTFSVTLPPLSLTLVHNL
jgi:hypothetical protein